MFDTKTLFKSIQKIILFDFNILKCQNIIAQLSCITYNFLNVFRAKHQIVVKAGLFIGGTETQKEHNFQLLDLNWPHWPF